MEELLQNCTERKAKRKLLVADALFIVAQASMPRKQLICGLPVFRDFRDAGRQI
jgi:hypothetical protein